MRVEFVCKGRAHIGPDVLHDQFHAIHQSNALSDAHRFPLDSYVVLRGTSVFGGISMLESTEHVHCCASLRLQGAQRTLSAHGVSLPSAILVM